MLGLRLRHLWLVWTAVGVQVMRQTDPAWAAIALRPLRGLWPVVVIWLLATAFAVSNLRALPAMLLLALGFTLNSLATAANGGMPFWVPAARLAGISNEVIGRQRLGHPPTHTAQLDAPAGRRHSAARAAPGAQHRRRGHARRARLAARRARARRPETNH